ncbi:MAG: septum formation initiator family protein [Gemmatimonadota bacterium]
MTRSRWAAIAVVALALVFALNAGEYSTLDWWTVRRQEQQELATVKALQRTVDSLTEVLHQVLTDPATQERIAREQYGMVRKGEFLYRIVPEDSARER